MENLSQFPNEFFRWVTGWSFVLVVTGLVFRGVIKPRLGKDAASLIGAVLRIVGIINLIGAVFLVLFNFNPELEAYNTALLLALGFGGLMIGWGCLWLAKDVRSAGE